MDKEARRLAELKSLEILDTAPESNFDQITQLAADMFDAPIALVSLVSADRQWFKSRVGLDACSTPRDISFCTHAIEGAEASILVVEDALLDPRFAENPLVTGAPHIRFYMGAVLTSAQGDNLGTLCVIDTRPRPRPNEREVSWLKKLAKLVVAGIERSYSERQSQKKQRYMEMAESVSGVGYWRLELETMAPVWSDAVYEIHGVTRENFDPKFDSAIDFYHPDDRPLVTANVERAIAAKSGFEFRLRLIRADGALRHVVSKASCELNDKGAVVALVGVFQDITNHVEAIEAVESSAASFRLLAENSRDIIAEFDRKGCIEFVSPACYPVLGYEAMELVGQSLWDYIHPDDKAQVAEKFAQISQRSGDEGQLAVRYRALHADGDWVWLEGRPRAVRDDLTGEVTGYQDAARDVRNIVAAEANMELARKEAEAAAQAKADFLANMSHELRTPLTAMLGFTNLIKDQPELDEETQSYVARALTAGTALRATVNDILDFSALEAGQLEIRPLAVRTGDYFTRVVDMLSHQASEKGLMLKLAGLETLPEVVALDPHRLRQVLLNLIGNGVKFTDAGAVEVTAAYQVDTSVMRIAVRDSGCGIADEDVSQLFQRFSQVDASTTRRHGGTGLGLAICQGLVEAMGGRIGVESESGVGSTFWFEVPAEPVDSSELIDAQEPADGRALAHCRVLVVDDAEANRLLLGRILGALGAEVTIVGDGEAAIEAARTTPFEIILMDRMMPGMGGVKATRMIRERPGPNREVPVVLLSADTTGLEGIDVFDGVAGKPLDMRELLGAMTVALNGEEDVANAA